MELTVEYLHEVLTYDPVTGHLFWKPRRGIPKPFLERPVGSEQKGYIRIKLLERQYLAHRIAWAMTHGNFPKDHIDHKNGNRKDNRIENLRLATEVQNGANRKVSRNNTTGFKGVSFHKKKGIWKCGIRCNNVEIHIGWFSSPQEAARAYDEKAIELHGEFARTNKSMGLI